MRLVTLFTIAIGLGQISGAAAQAPYLVKDIWPGSPGSLARPGVGVGDRMFFWADAPDIGRELWSTGGDPAATIAVDVTPGPAGLGPTPLFVLGNEVLFQFSLLPADGIWKSDGTAAGTRRISTLSPATGGLVAASLPDKVLFGDDGRYPVITDGTEQGTFPVPPRLGTGPARMRAVTAFANGFAMATEEQGEALWTNGTMTTRLILPLDDCWDAAGADGRLFLTCSGFNGGRLVVSDGTFAGTQYLPSFPGPLDFTLRAVGNLVFFTVEGVLWRSDGSPAGTHPVVMPVPAPTGIYMFSALASNGILYFSATTPETGRELWRTDGTAAGTFLLRDIDPGPGSGIQDNNSSWRTPAGGGIVFAAQTGATGMEVWESDGTTAGTMPRPEIVPGPVSSNPGYFHAAGGRVYFSAWDAAHGIELWAIDLAPGAVEVGDVVLAEGDAAGGTAVFAVRLQSAAAVPVVVSYATASGTAQAGSDFTAQSGTLTFAPGERERTVEVPLLADLADETNESFTLVLAPVGGTVIADGVGSGLILDDDQPRLHATGATVVEGNSGSTPAAFDVTVTTKDGGPVAESATLRFAGSSGTATPSVDYDAAVGTLGFPAGTASGTTLTATVAVLGDTFDEPNETFLLVLDGQNNLVVEGPPAVATIVDDDGVAAARPVELSHGTAIRADLVPPSGPGPDRDFYVLQQQPEASYELVVDETSGDAAPLSAQRVGSNGDVLQSAEPVGTGTARSLRWINSTFDTISDEHVRVESASCGTVCGADDTYRVRFYETTLRGARVNTTNGQSTVLLLQNLTDDPVFGLIHFRTEDGVNGGGQPYSIAARGTLVHDMSQNLFVPGSLWVTHDAPFGGVAGKVVALEPATGFGFDTPLTSRPR